jgi:hypothetical protein
MKHAFLLASAMLLLSGASGAQALLVPEGSGLLSLPPQWQKDLVLPAEIPSLLRARDLTVSGGTFQAVQPGEDPAADDSAAAPKRRLLPANMSFMEKGLWGENGLLRSIGLASPLTPEVRKSELGLRRTMLTIHQIGGFVTLASMVTAAYFGQQIIDGNNGYRRNHQIAVATTIAAYSATGLLAIFSPPPMIRRDEISTITVHKTLAWVHFLGMVTTPILGGMINRHADYYQRAHIHQISAYITTAALAASMIIVTF